MQGKTNWFATALGRACDGMRASPPGRRRLSLADNGFFWREVGSHPLIRAIVSHQPLGPLFSALTSPGLSLQVDAKAVATDACAVCDDSFRVSSSATSLVEHCRFGSECEGLPPTSCTSFNPATCQQVRRGWSAHVARRRRRRSTSQRAKRARCGLVLFAALR